MSCLVLSTCAPFQFPIFRIEWLSQRKTKMSFRGRGGGRGRGRGGGRGGRGGGRGGFDMGPPSTGTTCQHCIEDWRFNLLYPPNMFFLLVLFPGVPIQPCICLIAVVPLGIFLHACEDEMIYKSVNEKGKDFLFLFRATPKTPANFHALFIASSAIFQWICVS